MINRRQFLAAAGSLPLLNVPASLQGAEHPVKILLDTDIGSDIDDAVALAYLLRKPGCELTGITTVSGEAQKRAALASRLCQLAGKRVPIAPGAETPLIIEQRQTQAPQAEKLDVIQPFEPGTAINLMRQIIRRHPGEITLLAVGPLTNVALLFRADPEIPAMLKELVIMAGKYSDYPTPWGPTEWNAIVDPHATHIVFSSDVPRMTAFGLDITWQVSMTPAEVTRRFKGDPLLETVREWSEVWFRERELLHFHDPLAAAAIFKPDICGYQEGAVTVDLQDNPTAGITRFRAGGAGHRVATRVNAAGFFNEYFSVFRTSGP